jgi:hypothetical protein
MQLSQEAFDEMVAGLSQLMPRLRPLLNATQNLPTPCSIASKDATTYPGSGTIPSAWSIGTVLMEHASDHVSVLLKCLNEPVEIIAALTCVRSMLEGSAIAAWLLDPAIDAKTRAGRSLAYRFEGISQEAKFAGASSLPPDELKKYQHRIDELESEALSFGFARVVDKKKRRIGVAQQMPSATEMIEMQLAAGNYYRLLSAVAHGHFWALFGFFFRPSTAVTEFSGVPMQHSEKIVRPEAIVLAMHWTFHAFTTPMWNQCRYMGWNELGVEEVLEDCADKLQVPTSRRFWRS